MRPWQGAVLEDGRGGKSGRVVRCAATVAAPGGVRAAGGDGLGQGGSGGSGGGGGSAGDAGASDGAAVLQLVQIVLCGSREEGADPAAIVAGVDGVGPRKPSAPHAAAPADHDAPAGVVDRGGVVHPRGRPESGG